MKYISYLQGGGNVESEENGAMEQLVDLVTRALNNDQEAGAILSTLLKDNPELEETVMQIAQSISGENPEQMKCGGKTSKKEFGGKTKKAKCGCLIKKVGGRLIEVDGCTGLPIHKKGNKVKKMQDAAEGTLEHVEPTDATTPMTNQQLFDFTGDVSTLSTDDQARRNRLLAANQWNATNPTQVWTLDGNNYTTEESYNAAVDAKNASLIGQRADMARNVLGYTPRSNWSNQIVNAVNQYADGTDIQDRSKFMNELQTSDYGAGMSGRQRRKAWRMYKQVNGRPAYETALTQKQGPTTVARPESEKINIDWNANIFKNGGCFHDNKL